MINDGRPRCFNCRYWYLSDEPGADFGYINQHNFHPEDLRAQCRRRAPVAVDQGYLDWIAHNHESLSEDEVPDVRPTIVWPVTDASDWCGEFERVEGRLQLADQLLARRKSREHK